MYGHAPWLNDPYDTMVFAVRNSVWWIVGSNGNLAGIPQLFLLLFIFASPFSCCHSLWRLSAEARPALSPRDPR